MYSTFLYYTLYIFILSFIFLTLVLFTHAAEQRPRQFFPFPSILTISHSYLHNSTHFAYFVHPSTTLLFCRCLTFSDIKTGSPLSSNQLLFVLYVPPIAISAMLCNHLFLLRSFRTIPFNFANSLSSCTQINKSASSIYLPILL